MGAPADTPPKLSLAQLSAGIFVLFAGPWLGSFIGSFTGDAGTLWGTAIGSVVIPAVLGWLFLRASYHARNRLSRVPWRRVKLRYYAAAVPVAALVFVVAMGGLSAVEAGVFHRSLSAEVTHTRAGGTTLGGTVLDAHPASTSPSAPAPSVTPTASATTPVAPSAPVGPATVPAVSPSPSLSLSPSVVASGIPVTPAPTQSQQGEVTP
jgi:hypothetical protein